MRTTATLVAAALSSSLSWAVEPFVLGDIRVEGLQRVEPGTIFASLPFRLGETYTDEKGASAIRSLFALGLFKDVRLEIEGRTLVVVVQERPTVAEVLSPLASQHRGQGGTWRAGPPPSAQAGPTKCP